jgi:hypothetical protein
MSNKNEDFKLADILSYDDKEFLAIGARGKSWLIRNSDRSYWAWFNFNANRNFIRYRSVSDAILWREKHPPKRRIFNV